MYWILLYLLAIQPMVTVPTAAAWYEKSNLLQIEAARTHYFDLLKSDAGESLIPGLHQEQRNLFVRLGEGPGDQKMFDALLDTLIAGQRLTTKDSQPVPPIRGKAMAAVPNANPLKRSHMTDDGPRTVPGSSSSLANLDRAVVPVSSSSHPVVQEPDDAEAKNIEADAEKQMKHNWSVMASFASILLPPGVCNGSYQGLYDQVVELSTTQGILAPYDSFLAFFDGRKRPPNLPALQYENNCAELLNAVLREASTALGVPAIRAI